MRSLGVLEDIKTVERIGLAALALPLAPSILLLTWPIIAWTQVGHFPSHGHPDPKEMGMAPLTTCVLLITLLSPYLLLLGDVFSVLFLPLASLQRKKWLRNLLAIGLVNVLYFWVMLGGAFSLDLMNWIGD